MPLRQLLNCSRSLYERGVYKSGVAAYRFRAPRLAGHLLDHYTRLAGSADLIATRSTNGCPNPVDYAEFERSFDDFLKREWESWGAGAIPQPGFFRDVGPRRAKAPAKDLRVLAVMPRYVQSSERYVEYDLIDHTYRSMVNCGIQADIFDADRISYPALFRLDPQKAADDLAALRRRVGETRANILFFDGNFVGRPGSLNAEFLNELRATFGLKLIAFVGDAWGDYGSRAVAYWAPVCDLIVHLVPDLGIADASAAPDKLVCIPYPVNEKNFFPERTRSLDLSFFGSRRTYLRLFWLAHVRTSAARLRLNSNLQATLRTSDCPPMPEYAAIMRRSRMVLNFSTRDRTTKIITGRVWQALHSGVVLLEEENAATRFFFVPFIHYVPFENARQLRHMIEFFSKNRGWENRIGDEAAEFCAKHYAASDTWASIFARVCVSVAA